MFSLKLQLTLYLLKGLQQLNFYLIHCQYFYEQTKLYQPNTIKMDWKYFAQDMAAGTVSGVGNCLSGYLFDTLKVRMQMDHSLTMVSSLKSIIKNQGFVQLFSGIYYPLLTVPIINAIVFSSYELFKKLTKKTQLSLVNGIQNGAFAGLVNTVVVSPVELVKCHMQLDKENKYQSSSQCAKAIIKNHGIRGLFQGFHSTAFREIFAYAAQFATYEFMKQKIITKDKTSLGFVEGMAVGVCAGIACWVASYPQDIIKTMIQVSEPGTYKTNRYLLDGGFWNCAARIYQTKGWKGFWIGIQPCLVRAAVANAFGIAIYQHCQHKFAQSNLF